MEGEEEDARDEVAALQSDDPLSDALEKELETAGLVEGPDGGYGWVVVAASFLTNVIVDGVIFTSGAAFQPLWERQFNASSSSAAWTVSLLSGMYLLSGPIATALANNYGPRVAAIVGCIMAASGFILSMFAPELWVLYITFGVIGGIGFGLMYLPSIVVVCFYFNRRRALATGLAVCGSGIGTFIFAPFSRYLMEEYSWDQTMLIIAGITLNGLVAAAFYRPLRPSNAQVEHVAEVAFKYPELVREAETSNGKIYQSEISDRENGPLVAKGVEIERFSSQNSRGRATTESAHPFMSVMELRARERNTSLFSVHGLAPSDDAARREITKMISRDSVNILNRPMSRMDLFYTGSSARLASSSVPALHPRTGSRLTSRLNLQGSILSIPPADLLAMESGDWKERLLATISQLLDTSLLKSPTFLLLAIGGFLTLTGLFVPYIYLPRHAMSIGHSDADATFLVSILGIANIVFRVLCGWLSDQSWADPLIIHNVCLVIGGVATMAVPFLQPYWLLVIYCCLFGLASAVFASLRSIIAERLLGMDKLTNAYGLLMLFMGVAALVGSPIAGALADATGNYNTSFYVMGALITLSGLVSFPLMRLSRWEFPDTPFPSALDLEMQEEIPTGSQGSKKFS